MLDRLVEYIGLAGFARMRDAAFFFPPLFGAEQLVQGEGDYSAGRNSELFARNFFLGFVYR